jgi:hypothetical protein
LTILKKGRRRNKILKNAKNIDGSDRFWKSAFGFPMRGIYLVANERSEALCANLIYSIRKAGCHLPIRLIPFGGNPVQSKQILQEVEPLNFERFPKEAHDFVSELSTVLTDCPRGFLNRFLGWFGDWDEFIYSDNDIVALMNWERLFDNMPGNDLVHADEEYTTHGRFNYEQPDKIEELFGNGALLSALTAGHFVARRSPKMVEDMRSAMEWFRKNPTIPKRHDQSFLHVASMLGGWKVLNLCKPPHGWLSSWAGGYQNTLALVHAVQTEPLKRISHLHFSGGIPFGTEASADFLTANLNVRQRTIRLTKLGIIQLSGWSAIRQQFGRVYKGLRRRSKGFRFLAQSLGMW